MRRKNWLALMFAIIWELWKTRNSKIFYNKEVNIQVIKEQVLLWARSWQVKPGISPLNDLVSVHSKSRLKTSVGGVDLACPTSPLHTSMNYWWLCVDYLQKRNVYAIGGYFMSQAPAPKCFMWDVVSANSVTEATVSALEESIQFLVEEVGLRDEELYIFSSSKEITSWWMQQDNAPWDCRFVFNRLKNLRIWAPIGAIKHGKKSQFIWLDVWQKQCNFVTSQKVLWFTNPDAAS